MKKGGLTGREGSGRGEGAAEASQKRDHEEFVIKV